MPYFEIRLDPSKLDNPDADLRYLIPDLLVERSGGALGGGGYDYDQDEQMLIFLSVEDPEHWLPMVRSTLQSEAVLGNDLSSAVVTIAADA